MNRDYYYDKYIEDLPPELQDKAKNCKNKQELLELAADEDIEIPMDALENVSGGCSEKESCPSCGSTDLRSETYAGGFIKIYCGSCNYNIKMITPPAG